MTRLANAPALPTRIPASLLARQYESGLPADRNDMIQFQRLGDLNDIRRTLYMNVKTAWCNLMHSLTISDVGYVCELPIGWLVWKKFSSERNPRDRAEAQVAETVTRFRTLIDNCSPQTLQLAKTAAERQQAKTATDIDTWTKQIIQDVKNADD